MSAGNSDTATALSRYYLYLCAMAGRPFICDSTMKRRKTLRDLQLCEELAMSRSFPPFGNPLWQARKHAPRGAFLESSDAPGFLFRLSFADSNVDAQYQTPNNRLMHAWNSSLMHVPQLSPVDTNTGRGTPDHATDLHLMLYWLRMRKPRGEDIGDAEDGLPNGLHSGSVLQPIQWTSTHKMRVFPQIDLAHIQENETQQPISSKSAQALEILNKRNSALQLTAPVNLRPVPNAIMRSTDTAGLQHYQSAGVCAVYCKCIRYSKAGANDNLDYATQLSDSDSDTDVS